MAGECDIKANVEFTADKKDTNIFIKDEFIKAMQQIFVNQKMTRLEYCKMFEMIYEHCIKGRDFIVWVVDETQKKNTQINGSDEICSLINEFLSKHIKEDVLKGMPETDEDCLLFYSKEWKKFRLSSKILNAVCRYLNGRMLKRDVSRTVLKMAFQIWKECVYDHLNSKVSNAALAMLERNRNGEIINSCAINDVIQSYIDLGCIGVAEDEENLKIYELFEERILIGTSEYYSKDGEAALQKFYVEQKSFVDYMKFVRTRLHDEIKRTKMLHPPTEISLMRICYKVLIEKHIDIFDAEFRTYLNRDQLEDMGLMCSLAVNCPAVIKRLNTIFEEHVSKHGLNDMEECANEAVKDPKKYITRMLAVHNKYEYILVKHFKNEVGFRASLDKAASKFINCNAVTVKAKNLNYSAESLASYCHLLLKKSCKSMEDAVLEAALTEIMIIFRFIEDKDVFEGFYKRRLADRLVLDLSASDDAEALLISKMKQACGYEYTNKLQNMYQDIAVSKNLADKFREKVEASESPLGMDFRIKVLTHGTWPLCNDINVNLPIELTPAIDRFMSFYLNEHSGRKLTWIHKLSKADVIMNGLKQRYYIKANTLQTTVLLHYNEQTTFSIVQLIEYTGIDFQYMISLLKSMIKMKLLKCSKQGKLCKTSKIKINEAYNEPKIRFDITGKLESERRAEQKQTLHRVDEDRGHLIEAAIVRIMKMRKQLTNRELIGEVLSQLSVKFVLKVPHIKKSIDKLIDKEYLERDETKLDTYKYLA